MNRIYELRKQNGLSQQKLAEILNVHQTAVSQWEKGRTNPDMSILQAIRVVTTIKSGRSTGSS